MKDRLKDGFRPIDPKIIEQVDDLNEEVKILALNLAIYLARAKGKSDQLNRLEPDFIRLVNGTVKVVQELAAIINAARNLEVMVNDIVDRAPGDDPVEIKLKAILEQCDDIMITLKSEQSETGS